MIWTQKAELSQINRVCQAIVADAASGLGLKFGPQYANLVPALFGSVKLVINGVRMPATHLAAIKASAVPSRLSLSIGDQRSTAATTQTVLTLSGALCHELVHQKQAVLYPYSFAMSADIQTYWRANMPANAQPQEWLVGYYGTVFEFDAHAEQLACELWLADAMAGMTPRTVVSLAGIQSEMLDRIKGRLLGAGPPDTLVRTWLSQFEAKVNDALRSW